MYKLKMNIMNLQEFRRTRVIMTIDMYCHFNGLDTTENYFTDDVAKLHVYKKGYHIIEYIDGEFQAIFGNKTIRNTSLKSVEEIFWKEFAQHECNPKPKPLVTPMMYDALLSFKRATAELTEQWLDIDDNNDTQHLMNIEMTKDVPVENSFDDFNSDVAKWVNRLTGQE